MGVRHGDGGRGGDGGGEGDCNFNGLNDRGDDELHMNLSQYGEDGGRDGGDDDGCGRDHVNGRALGGCDDGHGHGHDDGGGDDDDRDHGHGHASAVFRETTKQ